MYKFKREIYVGDRSYTMWFGLVSKSRDRHSNFTLFLLTESPESEFSYAEKVKSGFASKAEAQRYAVSYAKGLIRQMEREQRENEGEQAEERIEFKDKDKDEHDE